MTLSHHANLVRVASVEAFFTDNLESHEPYDVYFERLGIDDVRELVKVAHTRPAEHSFRCLVVRTDFITLEAQNALLKILEEPPESSRFVFVLPPDFILLATLSSRFNVLDIGDSQDGNLGTEVFDVFFSVKYRERLESIEQALKQKDLSWQRQLKQGLIAYVAKNNKHKHFSDLEFVSRLLLTRGASNKMLLEHLALVL